MRRPKARHLLSGFFFPACGHCARGLYRGSYRSPSVFFALNSPCEGENAGCVPEGNSHAGRHLAMLLDEGAPSLVPGMTRGVSEMAREVRKERQPHSLS